MHIVHTCVTSHGADLIYQFYGMLPKTHSKEFKNTGNLTQTFGDVGDLRAMTRESCSSPCHDLVTDGDDERRGDDAPPTEQENGEDHHRSH